MAGIRIEKFGSLAEANHKLRGGIVGGQVLGALAGLVGAALTFSAPAGTHTFTQPAGRVFGQMLFADIKAQLEAAIAGLEVVLVDGKIGFLQAGAAVTLAALDEPARAILGLANNQAIAGEFINAPGGAAPAFASFEVSDNAIFVTIEV